MNKLIALTATLMALTACFHVRYATSEPIAAGEPESKWHHIAVYGLAEISDPVTPNQMCPNGFSRIESEESFVNGLVSFLTLGLYNPQSVTVYCRTK